MFLIIIRTIKDGWRNFFRNGTLSFSAVSVMTLSLFILSALFIIVKSADVTLKNAEENVNISVFFRPSASEESIMEDKKNLENFSEVSSVIYVSKDEALEKFKKNNENQPIIIRSLEEIGENPLLSYLVVKASDPSQYGVINNYLESAPFKDDISRVNYQKNKAKIDELNGFVSEIRRVGLGVVGVLSLVSIMIIFNTIKITIFTHRQEVEVMRLVGASNLYIKLPFIFQGIIYGVVASVFSMGLLFLGIKLAVPYTTRLFPSADLVSFYAANFMLIFSMQVLVGSLLGIVSSLIAIRKSLKI